MCDISDESNSLMKPKYLIVSRSDNGTLADYSPFIIKNAIDFACNGEVEYARKTKEGALLVKTKNMLQATKLLQLTTLGSHSVKVTKYSSVNFPKGVFYCKEMRSLSEQTIASELRTQNVENIRKLLKKVDGKMIETGVLIATFNSHRLPTHLMIGYQKVGVRPYIPLPVRCNKCYRFEHITRHCRGRKTCYNCAEHHPDDAVGIPCTKSKNCINCMDRGLLPCDHSSHDRRCPVFIRLQEIQAIKALQNVNTSTAEAIYSSSHQDEASLYSPVPNHNIEKSKRMQTYSQF